MSKEDMVYISDHARQRLKERFDGDGERLLGELLCKAPSVHSLARNPYMLRSLDKGFSAVIDYHRKRGMWIVVTVMDFTAEPKSGTAVINL